MVKNSLKEWTCFLGSRESPETQRPISEGNRNINQILFQIYLSIYPLVHLAISDYKQTLPYNDITNSN